MDYLLARRDVDFPTPRYENAEQNICVFWDKGCRSSTRFYRGRSMSGTFRPGDCLIVESTALANIRIGDVIVYRCTNHNGEEDALVHRIVAIQPDGLVARGDNNPGPDVARVTADNLLGLVTRIGRDGRTRRVLGGRMGLWRARCAGDVACGDTRGGSPRALGASRIAGCARAAALPACGSHAS